MLRSGETSAQACQTVSKSPGFQVGSLTELVYFRPDPILPWEQITSRAKATMPDHMSPVHQSAALMIMTLLAFGLRPSLSLCETRCEQSIPALSQLRTYWSRSFKRVGDQTISFEQFLLSLIQVSDNSNEQMRNLRTSLLNIIARYQDCVMACEHQFSKRSGRARRRKRTMKTLPETSRFSSRTPVIQNFLHPHPFLLPFGPGRVRHVT